MSPDFLPPARCDFTHARKGKRPSLRVFLWKRPFSQGVENRGSLISVPLVLRVLGVSSHENPNSLKGTIRIKGDFLTRSVLVGGTLRLRRKNPPKLKVYLNKFSDQFRSGSWLVSLVRRQKFAHTFSIILCKRGVFCISCLLQNPQTPEGFLKGSLKGSLKGVLKGPRTCQPKDPSEPLQNAFQEGVKIDDALGFLGVRKTDPVQFKGVFKQGPFCL